MTRKSPYRTFNKSALPAIETIAERLIGSPERIQGSRLLWRCPFHDERSPSFTITRGRGYFRCFGCGAKGDVIKLIEMIERTDFKGALAWLDLDLSSHPLPKRRKQPPRINPSTPDSSWQEIARRIIDVAEETLWSPKGCSALRYLQKDRGFDDETIRSARLGFIAGPIKINELFVHKGIVIPWIDGDRIESINIRRPKNSINPDGSPASKYVMVKGSRRGGIYPNRRVILSGEPLVISEGEFDALLLGQILQGIIPVVTLGSSTAEPKPEIVAEIARSKILFLAVDSDSAGDECASRLSKLGRCVRIRPPGACKDWTDAFQARFDILAHWLESLLVEEKRFDFLERAAILEFDAGFDRRIAVLKAYIETRLKPAIEPDPP